MTREQFYPAVVYLTTSKPSIVVLCNQAVVLIIAAAAALKALFLGELRTTEVERVNETLRFTIPEVRARRGAGVLVAAAVAACRRG